MVTRLQRGAASFLGLLVPRRIRWKIVAPYAVLTIVVAVVGTYLATRLVTGSLEERFDNQLAEAARVTSDAVVRRERQHLETVRSIAFTVGVSEATAAGDAQALRDLVEPILANARTEYVDVLDASGDPVLSLRLADSEGLRYEEPPATGGYGALDVVQKVFQGPDEQGDKFAQLGEVDGEPVLYTAGPVRDGDEVLGVVLVGSSLESFLPAVKLEALADVTFYGLDGAVLASTLARDEQSSATLAEVDFSEGPEALAGLRQSKTLFGRGFDLLYGELRIRDETVGVFSIALPSSFISSAGAETRVAMMAVFGIATAAVLAIGVLVAHGVTGPLLSLVGTARAVAAGDLTVRSALRTRDEVGTLATSFNIMTDRLATQHLQTIRALTSAIDARDPYTAGHSVRVGQLSLEIGRELELPRRDLQFLEIGGYLHDVGKIGIRDQVLLKEGPLTEEERRLIEDHPRIGLNIVQYVDLADEVLQVISGHHEKLDGTGYPYGLTGDDITIFARIAAVSDIYDALTTERPYKVALTMKKAVRMLEKEVRGGHLDARAVDGLVRALPRWERRLRTEKSLRGFLVHEFEELGTEPQVV